MTSVRNPDGTYRYTLVQPTDTPIAIMAPNGSYRFVDAETDNGSGLYAPNGAWRVNFTTVGKLHDNTGAFTLWGLNNGKESV